MSIRSYRDTFTAGVKKQYRGGSFFNIAELTDEVTVRLFSNMGNTIAVLENIGAGFWIKLDNGTDSERIGSVEIESATAQTIDVIIGDGEFGANKTSTTITGGRLDAALLRTTEYKRTSISTALNTVVTPAANTNGIIITSALAGVAGGETRIMAKTSAPASLEDGVLIYAHYSSSSGTYYQEIVSPVVTLPIQIPAGFGLYEQSSSAIITSYVQISYEVL